MPKVGMQPIRRSQLIAATLEAVDEVGMGDASIAFIARKAGVSNGIISHYFQDKNGLLNKLEEERKGLLADGTNPAYAQALETIASADSKDDLAALYQEARRTSTTADDALVSPGWNGRGRGRRSCTPRSPRTPTRTSHSSSCAPDRPW